MSLQRGGYIDDAGAVLQVFRLMDQGASCYAAARTVSQAMSSDPLQQRSIAGRLEKKVAALQKAKGPQ